MLCTRNFITKKIWESEKPLSCCCVIYQEIHSEENPGIGNITIPLLCLCQDIISKKIREFEKPLSCCCVFAREFRNKENPGIGNTTSPLLCFCQEFYIKKISRNLEKSTVQTLCFMLGISKRRKSRNL